MHWQHNIRIPLIAFFQECLIATDSGACLFILSDRIYHALWFFCFFRLWSPRGVSRKIHIIMPWGKQILSNRRWARLHSLPSWSMECCIFCHVLWLSFTEFSAQWSQASIIEAHVSNHSVCSPFPGNGRNQWRLWKTPRSHSSVGRVGGESNWTGQAAYKQYQLRQVGSFYMLESFLCCFVWLTLGIWVTVTLTSGIGSATQWRLKKPWGRRWKSSATRRPTPSRGSSVVPLLSPR